MDELGALILGQKPKEAAAQPKGGVVTDELLNSLRQVESGGGKNVYNKESGAAGPYQHIPGTVKMLSAKYGAYDPYNEQQSRERTKQYLEDLVAQNKGDVRAALGQYGGHITKDPNPYINKVLGGAGQAEATDELGQLILGASTKEEKATIAQEQKPKKSALRNVIETVTSPTAKDVATGGVLGAARRIFGPAAAAVTDIALQAPGAVIGQAAYASSRASGRTPEEATQFAQGIQQTISPRQQAIGEISGTTQEPGYQAIQGAAKYIGENIDKGIDWLSQKLGMPKEDVANIAGSLSLAAPEVASMAKGAVAPYTAKVKPTIEAWKQEIGTLKPKPDMAGVGAAEVSAQNLRKARAAELPIPMDTDLMKSDITRRPEDIQFAKTMAKDERYAGIFQENASVKNEKLQANLQALSEQTGAQQLGIEPAQLSQQLVDVVGNAKKNREATVRSAYDAARAAGEMAEQVPVSGLTDFVKNNASASKNAPVISAIGAEIKRLSKDGNISLNDIEELRKMVSVLSQDSGPNSYYGNQALKLIDKATEGKGGDLYKQARGLYSSFKKEFENTPIVREILSTKPGTTERTVALENLVDRTLLNKSTAEVQKLFGSLQRMEGGPEIINELKGALADKIAQEVTKGSGTDMYGRPYVSPAQFKKTLAKLDKGGKLDFIFGKRQAEQYRTLHKVSEDILTIPKEVVSTSGSGETVKAVLTGLAEAGAWSLADMGGVPVGTIARYGTKAYKEKKQLNKINEFVNYGKRP